MQNTDRSLRGRVAVVGVGETDYFKRGEAPDAELIPDFFV